MIVRNLVVFVNPPNTSDLKSQATESFTCGVEHTDWANFPHLGILSLASFINLKGKGQFKVAYFDGVVCPWKKILNFIIQNKSTILAVCVSCLTASYGSALRLLEHVKKTDSSISTLVGNDHFSALYKTILVKQNNLIDYGLVGNEIYESLFKTLMYLKEGKQPEVFNIPGLSAYKNGKVILGEQKSEAIFTEIDYSLLDSYFPHSEIYQYNFQNRISPRIDKVFGLQIRSGVPVEIARGCIKFKHNNACSFCSIQHGGMWKNEIEDPNNAWKVLLNAVDSGYDYLYVTADELPMTFSSLIRSMHNQIPHRWQEHLLNKNLILTGYARADGLNNLDTVKKLRDLGFRLFIIGLDAGTKISLAAMNKPVYGRSLNKAADALFSMNIKALKIAYDLGIKIKAGFVLGHIGMNRKLLNENVRTICSLIRVAKETFFSVDVEILSPEPGSKDFRYLSEPIVASDFAEKLNLKIASERLRKDVAHVYSKSDFFERKQAIQDYVKALMPDCTLEELIEGRNKIRQLCNSLGILVGNTS